MANPAKKPWLDVALGPLMFDLAVIALFSLAAMNLVFAGSPRLSASPALVEFNVDIVCIIASLRAILRGWFWLFFVAVAIMAVLHYTKPSGTNALWREIDFALSFVFLLGAIAWGIVLLIEWKGARQASA